MSLLISALQKAEQGRKQSVDKADVEDFLLELAPQEEDAAGVAGTHGEVDAAQDNAAKQKAAAQLLAARASASAVKLETRISPFMLGLLLLLLLLMAGAGIYWYLSSLTQPEVMIAEPVAIPAPGTAAASHNAATADVAADEQGIAPQLAEIAQDQHAAPQEQNLSQPQLESPPSKTGAAAATAPMPIQSASALPASFGEPLTSSEASRVSVSKNRPATGVSRDVMTAYEAFNRGDDNAAQQAYRQALQADVRNIDALLGMAAVAARQGRQADALAWYGKVLELEPRNTTAQTALVDLQGQADPQASESRLKTMISLNPQAAHLQAALGQLYISQGQWPLAQQSFFEAHHLDATHPEYAFNLAVSLDHMGKAALALQYYLQAQALLVTHAAPSVDQAQLATRIQQLQ